MSALYHTTHTLMDLTDAFQMHIVEEINGAPTARVKICFQLSLL